MEVKIKDNNTMSQLLTQLYEGSYRQEYDHQKKRMNIGKQNRKIERCRKIEQHIQNCINNLYSTLKSIQLYRSAKRQNIKNIYLSIFTRIKDNSSSVELNRTNIYLARDWEFNSNLHVSTNGSIALDVFLRLRPRSTAIKHI